ncbi:MAG TPA: hypothetical protein VFC44_09275, partial [Candidatus Saccharimonadales bacterium]|nr:hypothetical protein [Candidatus Saccharimonadales bacterium]
ILSAGLLAAPGESSPAISIVTVSTPGQAAWHGVEKMAAALRDKHVPFEMVKSPVDAEGKVLIVCGLSGDQSIFTASFQEFARSVPPNPEGLAIQKLDYKGKPVCAIAGSDDCGLMYGELDVADRIRWSTSAESPLSAMRDTVEKPGIASRGITLFAMNRAYWESRFYDESYWRRYLDLLAQNRFNSMVVVFGYENGGFLAPCYPYFFDVPEFPEVKMIGLTSAQQKRNVEALTRLIAMAHARGIRLSAGIWDHIYRGNVQNGGSPGGNAGLSRPTPSLVWGMNATNLIPYTQAALKAFLKKFPAMDGIQFRMHYESGLKPSEQDNFWKAAFSTIMENAPKMPLDLRAKGLTAAEIKSALDSGVNFHLSTKYWMEQMGLPFHPTHINPRDQGSARHSYAGLLVYPKKYQMNWQLWNGGTSRILLWGDPDFARRFVASAHLYDGDSFEVDEPLATKMEGQLHDQKPFDLLKPSARYYDYEFERYWHFFQVFGRIGYNINAPSELWDKEFENRFGAAAGPLLENALHRASWILPRIIASSYPYSGFPMTAGWPEKQHLGDLPSFAKATLSDVQLFENFDEEAQLLIKNGETAKVRPQETSRWFAQTADYVIAQIGEAEKKIETHHSKEFDSTIMDLKILANLALYHSQRIPAAVSYRLYDRTKDPAALDDALVYERKAVAAWRQIVDVAGDTYAGDLMFGARSRNLCGHWRDELVSLESSLASLEALRKGIPLHTAFTPSPHYAAAADSPEAPTIIHQPILAAPALQPLTIRAAVKSPAGIKWVQVLYRSVNQTKDYEALAMKQIDDHGNYEAVISASKIDSKFDFMYFLQAMDNQHCGAMFPDFNRQTPYFVVRLEPRK